MKMSKTEEEPGGPSSLEPQMSSVREGTVDVGALIAPKCLVHEV